jgi:hypothetical protein
LRIVRRGRVLPHPATAPTTAGRVRLTRLGSLAPGWHRLDLRLAGGWGDRLHIWGGGLIKVPTARRLLEARLAESGEGTAVYLGDRCRAFGPRRVDCEVRVFEDFQDNAAGYTDDCLRVSSLALAPTGILRDRTYACGDTRRAIFQRRPRGLTPGVPLSPSDPSG